MVFKIFCEFYFYLWIECFYFRISGFYLRIGLFYLRISSFYLRIDFLFAEIPLLFAIITVLFAKKRFLFAVSNLRDKYIYFSVVFSEVIYVLLSGIAWCWFVSSMMQSGFVQGSW